MTKTSLFLLGLFIFTFLSINVCADDGDIYYFVDNELSWDTTQFGLMLQLLLFIVFVWISFKIPNSEGQKGWHKMPFSGGLFMFFAGIDFLSMAILLRTYLTGWINDFLVIVGIVLLIYGILQAFYYADG